MGSRDFLAVQFLVFLRLLLRVSLSRVFVVLSLVTPIGAAVEVIVEVPSFREL